MEFEEGEIVLCTVDRIIGTTVFVKIEEGTEKKEGSIVLSEIAPGRIRNIRDYVVPKKKIVCKILRISGNTIDLSLRRVTKKEQKEVMERFNQEKSYKNILKTILGEKTEKIIEEIEKTQTIYNFIQESKENSETLEKLIGKESSKKILEIIKSEKTKKAIIKKEFTLTTKQPNGLTLIKEILEKIKDAEIKYISAGRYYLKKQAENIKKADQIVKEILKQIEDQAKQKKLDFKIKDKKV